jgi:type IV pilus assembly protein PilB
MIHLRKKEKLIGQLLMERGAVNSRQLEDALNEQKKTKEYLGSILMRRKVIQERDLLWALSEQFGIPCMSIRYCYIDWVFVKKFSPSLILDHKCFPVKGSAYSVTMAITNPLDIWSIKKAEEEAGAVDLKLVLVSEQDMRSAIDRYEQYLRKDSHA